MKKTPAAKKRVDNLLVENGQFESRNKARAAIMAGQIRVGDDHLILKANERWVCDTIFSVHDPMPYVSRGAYKLLPAIEKYKPDLSDEVALDIGASTGGFTEVLLQYGAAKVYAVDVGIGQLHLRLRKNPRVICLEKINARYLNKDIVPVKVDISTIDVSFISALKILPAVNELLLPGALIFLLIKPQFEASRNEVQKGGVIRSEEVRTRVVREVVSFAQKQLLWESIEVMKSPIRGPKGNQEFMAIFKKVKKTVDNPQSQGL